MFFIRLVLGNSSDGYTVKADFKEPDSYEKKVSGKFTLNVKEIENLHTSDLEDLRVYGTKLGQAVFSDEVKTAFDNTLARLGNDVLHIAISVEDNDLRRLRWERLCYPKNESWEFLRLDQKTPFSIEIGSISNKRYPSISRVGLKALVVVADLGKNSYNLAPFDAHKTVEGIQNALGPSISSTVLASSGGIQLPNAHGLPTIEEICKWLSRESFAIMHIVCHGVLSKITDEVNRPSEFETQLFLRKSDPVDTTREDSHVQRLSGKEFLTELSRQETKLPHLTFLCSCSSASPASTDGLGGLGQRMVRELGVRAVVAMTQPVRIDLATELSKNFYEHLRMTGEVDRSLNAATSSVRKSDGNVLVPTLFSCIGGRSLFVDNRELTTEEWEHGLKRVKPLVVERSPIRFSEFENLNQKAIVAVQILKNAGNNALTKDEEKAKSNLEKIIDELEPLCQDVIENSFEHLAKDKPLSNSKYCKNCPFPGLGFFDRVNLGDTEEDYRPFFFGRYDLSCKILDLLEKSRFLAVVGGSGTGKSSLLRAGAIVELERKREKKDITALFTPGTDPLFRIERALNSTAELELIVVDQFEELFTLCTEKIQKDFVAKLYEVTRRIPVLIALREDYLTQAKKIERFNELIEANDKNVMVLQSLEKSDLKRVVLEQLQSADLILDNGLIDTIFDELENPNAAMPLVQHFMRELWKRRHGRRLKLVEYAAIGGVNGAITKTAEDKYESLTREIPESKTILPFIFEKLTRIDTSRRSDGLYRDSRKPELLSELSPKGIDPNLTEKIVDSLVESKLLTINKNEEGEREVELSHEPLLQDWDRLKEWIAAARNDSELIEKIVKGSKAFIKTGKKSGPHLREDDLKAASNLVTKVPCRLTDTQIDFVVKCRENQEQARKYWNIVRWSVSSVILCLAIWLGFSLRRTLIERARAQKGVVELGIASGTAQRDRGYWIKSVEHFQKAAEASQDAIEREMLQIAASHLSTGITRKTAINMEGLDGVSVINEPQLRFIHWNTKGKISLSSLDQDLSLTNRGSIQIAKGQDREEFKIELNQENTLGLAITKFKDGKRVSNLFEITDNTIKDHGKLLSEDTIDAAFRSNRLATVSEDGDIKVFKVSLDNQIVRPQLIETTLKAKGKENLEIDMNNEGIVLVNSDKGPVILKQEGNRLVDVTPEGQGNPSKQKALFIGAKQWVIWEGDSKQLHIYSFDLDEKTVKAVDVEGPLNGLWPQGNHGFLLQTNQAQKLYLHVDPENWAKGVEVPTDADLMGKVMSVHHMDFDPGTLTCFVQADKGIFLVTCELENRAIPKVYKLSKRKEVKYDAIDKDNVFVGFEDGLIDKQTRFGSEFELIAEVTQGARVDGIVSIPNGLISWSKENETIVIWQCQSSNPEKLEENGADFKKSLYIGADQLATLTKRIQPMREEHNVNFWDISKVPPKKMYSIVSPEPISNIALLCEGNLIALHEKGDLSKIDKDKFSGLSIKFRKRDGRLRSRKSSDGKEIVLWSGEHWAKLECADQSSIKSGELQDYQINDVAILKNETFLLCTNKGIQEKNSDGTSQIGILFSDREVLRISTTGKSAIIRSPGGKVEYVQLADPEMRNSWFLHKDHLEGFYDPIQRFLLDDDSVIAWSEKELYRWSKNKNLRTKLWDRPEGESRGVIYATKKSTRYVIAWCGSQIRVIDSFNGESLMDFNERTVDNENIHECELIGDGPSFTTRVDGGLYIHRLRPATLEEIQWNTNAAMRP